MARKTRLLRRHCALQGWRCYWCGEPMVWRATVDAGHEATIEHLAPKAKGGPLTFDNTAAACKRCNHKRGRLDAETFRMVLDTERGHPPG